MLNLTVKLFSARNPKFDLAFVAIVFVAFVMGCGGSSSAPQKPIPAPYLGTWTGADGTTISIRNDNTGDYKAGSKTIDGAAVEVDETGNEIKFTMLGIDVGKYKIDKAPSGSSMTLNGMVYRKAGGGTATSNNTSSDRETTTADDSDVSSADMPVGDELDSLVGDTMESFNSAVQSDDFADFHSQISQAWQEQITADKLQEVFSPLVKQKVDLTPKPGSKLTYSPKPTIDENGMMVLNGSYQTVRGKKLPFKLTYVKEDSDWKLFGIRVNP